MSWWSPVDAVNISRGKGKSEILEENSTNVPATYSNATRDFTTGYPMLRVIMNFTKDIFRKQVRCIYQIWSIACLFLARCPFTIARFVSSQSFNSFNRFVLRTNAHIGQKVNKRQPSLADLDTFAAISRIIRGLRVATALNHSFPSLVCGRHLMVCGVSMHSEESIYHVQ